MQDLFQKNLSDEELYKLLSAHDARFDGRFFVGVSSTGIYCRAVCSAKTPKFENCTFYRSAAEAEAAGYRPCLKCRPELAPGIPPAIENDTLARQAADRIKNDLMPTSISAIAQNLNISERHLRRVFENTYGVSPAAYRNTNRLLLSKSLLTDTTLPIIDIAYACGFSSLRRFNDAFLQQYRMPPSRFRKDVSDKPVSTENEITIKIGYRPPYRFDLLLDFLKERAIEGVEVVQDDSYARVVNLDTLLHSTTQKTKEHGFSRNQMFQVKGESKTGWIQVKNIPAKNCLALTVSSSLFNVLPLVIAKTKRLFDTDCVPTVVSEGLTDFYERTSHAYNIAGIRLPGSFDGFEMAVRAILGQQITVKAANTLAGRVALEFGELVEISIEGLSISFPGPEAFCGEKAEQRLGELGVIRQRAHAICSLAQALCNNEIDLHPGADIESNAQKLLLLPGIGDWTVQYLLMRVCAYPNAFPATDYAVQQVFQGMKNKDLKELSLLWSPWRAYAVMSLWSVPHEWKGKK